MNLDSIIELYVMRGSAPCRAVILACCCLGLNYKIIDVDLFKNEHKTPEFLAMNPDHTVPTMKHGDFCLSESRAILLYLMDLAGTTSSDEVSNFNRSFGSRIDIKAEMSRLLFWDIGTLYPSIAAYVYPQLFEGKDKSNLESEQEKLMSNLDNLVKMIERSTSENSLVSGSDKFNVADLSIAMGLSMLEFFPDILSDSRYETVCKWQTNLADRLGSMFTEVNKPFQDWKNSKMNN